jgi:hypothetical protein
VCAPVQRDVFSLLTSAARARTALIGDTYVFAYNVLRSGNIFSGIAGTQLVEYDFNPSDAWRPALVNGSLFLSGGITSVFDGNRIFEAAFLCRPPDVSIDTGTSGSQTFVTGRSYVATYEYVDAHGNWHVSGVSNPISTDAITSKKVVVSVMPLTITSRAEDVLMPFGSGVRISIWGTTDGNEEPYYRMTSISNYQFQESIAWEDTLAEADFTSNMLLYATGNLPGTGASQDHRAPQGLRYHVSYNGMLVGAAGTKVVFGSQPITGQGTWFSPLFVRFISEEATGMAVQDGSVIIYTEHGAWITAGDPPSNNGLQGGLSTPRQLALEFGCINANSILTTDMGTFYQSRRGIELLTRGQTGLFIGHEIEDTTAAYPIVTSAVLDEENGLAIFSLAESETDGVASAVGVDVVYDLKHQIWVSRDVKKGATALQASQDAIMTTILGERTYAWLSTDGLVYQVTPATWLDGSTWITQKAVTSWIHLDGLNGEQFLDQVLLLASRYTDHDVTISIAFDFVESYTSVRTFQASSTELREWFVKEIEQTTSQAVRVKIEDATPSAGTVDTGRGGAWTCLTINGQPHGGPKRSSAVQRGG